MANAEFLGSALYAQWIATNAGGTAIGTVLLATDFRNFTYTPSIDVIDATAGADSNKRKITYLKDGQVSCTQILQSDIGSATMAILTEGVIGTLTWAEAGTASTMPKHVANFICMGSSYSTPYNDVVTISTTWQQNGTRVDSAYS